MSKKNPEAPKRKRGPRKFKVDFPPAMIGAVIAICAKETAKLSEGASDRVQRALATLSNDLAAKYIIDAVQHRLDEETE